jgi:hypothetical protein
VAAVSGIRHITSFPSILAVTFLNLYVVGSATPVSVVMPSSLADFRSSHFTSITTVSFANVPFGISPHVSFLSIAHSDQTIYSFAVCGISVLSGIVVPFTRLFSVMVYPKSLLPVKRYDMRYTPMSVFDLIRLHIL